MQALLVFQCSSVYFPNFGDADDLIFISHCASVTARHLLAFVALKGSVQQGKG